MKKCKRIFIPTTGTYIHRYEGEIYRILSNSTIRGFSHDKINVRAWGINVLTAFDWRHKILMSIPENDNRFEGETQVYDLWFLYRIFAKNIKGNMYI